MKINKYKIYFQLVFAMACIAVLVGFVLPALASAKSTLAVGLAVLLVSLTGAFLLWFPQYFLKQFQSKGNDEKN